VPLLPVPFLPKISATNIRSTVVNNLTLIKNNKNKMDFLLLNGYKLNSLFKGKYHMLAQ